MELWDLYDRARKPLGRVCQRGETIMDGEFHLISFAVIVNSRDEVLLTLRAPEKASYPNLWGNTGGAVQAGESTLDAIVREVREETGICADASEFVPLCTDLQSGKHAITDIFLLRRDVALESLTLQPGETVKARWANNKQVLQLIRMGRLTPPDAARWRQVRRAMQDK